MPLNYLVKASNTVTIQSVSVTISAEYQQGNLPTVLTSRANGQISKEGKTPVYMDLNANYNVEGRSFNNCNGSNIPAGFVQELETAIVETYDLIKIGEVKA